jgi:hypothetical protein
VLCLFCGVVSFIHSCRFLNDSPKNAYTNAYNTHNAHTSRSGGAGGERLPGARRGGGLVQATTEGIASVLLIPRWWTRRGAVGTKKKGPPSQNDPTGLVIVPATTPRSRTPHPLIRSPIFIEPPSPPTHTHLNNTQGPDRHRRRRRRRLARRAGARPFQLFAGRFGPPRVEARGWVRASSWGLGLAALRCSGVLLFVGRVCVCVCVR